MNTSNCSKNVISETFVAVVSNVCFGEQLYQLKLKIFYKGHHSLEIMAEFALAKKYSIIPIT